MCKDDIIVLLKGGFWSFMPLLPSSCSKCKGPRVRYLQIFPCIITATFNLEFTDENLLLRLDNELGIELKSGFQHK